MIVILVVEEEEDEDLYVERLVNNRHSLLSMIVFDLTMSKLFDEYLCMCLDGCTTLHSPSSLLLF